MKKNITQTYILLLCYSVSMFYWR